MDDYSMVSPGAGVNAGIGTSTDGGSDHATFYHFPNSSSFGRDER
jgi:hypothetical protein